MVTITCKYCSKQKSVTTATQQFCDKQCASSYMLENPNDYGQYFIGSDEPYSKIAEVMMVDLLERRHQSPQQVAACFNRSLEMTVNTIVRMRSTGRYDKIVEHLKKEGRL
jgi:hypothetical protein